VSNPKSLVFISHITEEKELALEFKSLVEGAFLGLIDVFVSSDENSIHLGQRWLDQITVALRTCAVEIILCSTKSVKRPWINFEAGAGWVRDIPVIPLCHSGTTPSSLPMPLNLLQAAAANQISSLKLVFPVLAQALGAKTPTVDFAGFVSTVQNFEARYMFWDGCNDAFQQINNYSQELINLLRTGNTIALQLTEQEIAFFSDATKFLQENDVLQFNRVGGVSIGPMGMHHNCALQPLRRLPEVFNDERFKFKTT